MSSLQPWSYAAKICGDLYTFLTKCSKGKVTHAAAVKLSLNSNVDFPVVVGYARTSVEAGGVINFLLWLEVSKGKGLGKKCHKKWKKSIIFLTPPPPLE